MKLKQFITQAKKIGSGNKCRIKFVGAEERTGIVVFSDDCWTLYFDTDSKYIGWEADEYPESKGYKYGWYVGVDWDAEQVEYIKPLGKRGRSKGSKNKKNHIAQARKKVRTIEDVQVGDIVIDDDGFERKVLGEEKRFVISIRSNFEIESGGLSVELMKAWGFTLKQPEKKIKLNGEYTRKELEELLK